MRAREVQDSDKSAASVEEKSQNRARAARAAAMVRASYSAAPVSPETWLERREAWRTNAMGGPTENVAIGFDTSTDEVLSVLRNREQPVAFEEAVPLPTMITALNIMWDEDGTA